MTLFLFSPTSLYLAASLALSQAGWDKPLSAVADAALAQVTAPASQPWHASSWTPSPGYEREYDLEPTAGCAYCDGGLCTVCGHGVYRTDSYGVAWNCNDFAAPADPVAFAPAPRATEPEEAPVSSQGWLPSLAAAAAKMPGISWLRQAAGSMATDSAEALRSLVRWTLGGADGHAVTCDQLEVGLADNTDAVAAGDEIRRWFGESQPDPYNPEESPARAVADASAGAASEWDCGAMPYESAAEPAVTSEVGGDFSADGSDYDYSESSTSNGRWPAATAIDDSDDFQGYSEPAYEAPPGASQPVVLRSAAVVLERLGHAMLGLSGRLHNLADAPRSE